MSKGLHVGEMGIRKTAIASSGVRKSDNVIISNIWRNVKMLKKTDVYEFINKCENKARNSIKESYDTELKKAIEETLNNPANKVLKDAIKQVEISTSTGIEARNIVRKHIPRFDNYNCYFTSRNISDIKKDAFDDGYSFPEEFEQIKAVHVDYKEKLRKSEEGYRDILHMAKNKKTAEQAKTALIALGFDVAWLDKLSNLPVALIEAEFKIDKSVIFPCGSAGVE